MIRNWSLALALTTTLSFSASVQAHLFGGHGTEVDYTCKPHHHGRFLHRCADEPHPRLDESHVHRGLPPYYARNIDFYLGVKGGMLGISSGAFEADGMTTAVVAGYGTHELSLEAEVSQARVRIIDDFSFSRSTIMDSGRYDTVALFGVYRSSGNVYGKMKVGYRKYWIDTTTQKIIDTDVTAGVGVGKYLGRFILEGEYTMFESNVQLFSVGVNYKF